VFTYGNGIHTATLRQPITKVSVVAIGSVCQVDTGRHATSYGGIEKIQRYLVLVLNMTLSGTPTLLHRSLSSIQSSGMYNR
jgi:hypothetical protein